MNESAQQHITHGDVVITWQGGAPLRANLISNPNRNAVVPAAFWDALQRVVRPALHAPFTYLAFLESDYVEAAHNPSSAEDSWGVLQVNRNAWPQYTVDELNTYEGNLAAAQAIYDIQGFGAWYNSANVLGLPFGAPLPGTTGTLPATPGVQPTVTPTPAPQVIRATLTLHGLTIVDVERPPSGDTVTLTATEAP